MFRYECTQNNKSWNDKKSEKRKLHTQKYPHNHTINTVSSYALSIHVNHSSFFEEQRIYACYTSLQQC